MQKSIIKRIHKEEKKLLYETQVKCSYVIDIYRDKIEFYFIVPVQYVSIVQEKIREVWPKITIDQVECIAPFDTKNTTYELMYKKEDALSLEVNRKTNDPLNAILNVVEILKDDDRVSILYNFMPCNSQLACKNEFDRTITKYRNNEPVDRNKLNGSYIFKSVVLLIAELLDMFVKGINEFIGTTNESNQFSILESAITRLDNRNVELSPATKNKKNDIILNTQIAVISQSKDKTRATNNANVVCQSYKAIEYDNELIYKPINKIINIDDYSIGTEINKVSINECQNFLQLPGKELITQFKNINHINTLETQTPKDLQEGTKCIGINTYKGLLSETYLTNDKDYKNLALAIIGPTRSGKTSLLSNLANDSIKCEECVIVLDFIENCGLSDDIKMVLDKDKILEINLYDTNKLQGIGYNEAFTNSNDVFIRYESAKKQTSQVITLINSINISNSDFTPRMERFLTAACLVCFINNKALKDVIKVLNDYEYRDKVIKEVPINQKDNLEEYIRDLNELDEWSKETKDKPSVIIGTKNSYISGVVDRFNKLKSNTYMELMLKKNCDDNINLLDEMEKNQAIFIKIPEAMFSTAEERDMMVTYWLTKIWMCGQARAWKIKDRYDRKTVTVITDEIAQLKSSEEFIGNKLDQTAKFGIKFILSTMYINQLRIREKLRTANTSYIFIAGSEKSNFKELKEEFEQFEFTLDDMLNLKRYHSLNYIKYKDGYWAGITKLPNPLKKNNI
jgi:hypothetical protein